MWCITSFSKALCETPGIRSRFLMGWLAFVSLYVLAYPTLFSAATGYFSPLEEVIMMPGEEDYFNVLDWQISSDEVHGLKPCLRLKNG